MLEFLFPRQIVPFTWPRVVPRGAARAWWADMRIPPDPRTVRRERARRQRYYTLEAEVKALRLALMEPGNATEAVKLALIRQQRG